MMSATNSQNSWQLTFWSVLIAAFVIFTVSTVLNYRRQLKILNYIPGLRSPFYPLGLPGVLIPTSWWNPGYYFPWRRRHTLYKHFGNDTISVVSFLAGPPSFYTANLDVARQVAGGALRTSFIKPENASTPLLLWGMNLLAADRETWRRHRRIVAPAFDNSLHEMVWTESLKTYRDMVSVEKWEDKKEIVLPIVQDLMFKFTLLIIGKCGFGFEFDWASPPKLPDRRMTVQEALRITATRSHLAIFTPKWAHNLPFAAMHEMRDAHHTLLSFMQAQAKKRKEDVRPGMGGSSYRKDVFTTLVKANEDENSKLKLDDSELIGNVFILLAAGHESTASTISAAMALIAVHEDIQEEVYQQIISVVGLVGDPRMEDYANLDKVRGVFFEALRMFPAAHVMIRDAYEDTTLQIPNPVGEEGTKSVAIEKDTVVIVDMVGIQYNPRYFDEPEKFKPSRWNGVASESESFSAFSIGTRACIGRKFATLEAVCFLTLLLRDFRIVPLLGGGETKEQWKKKVLDVNIALTLGVRDVPIKFVRRM